MKFSPIRKSKIPAPPRQQVPLIEFRNVSFSYQNEIVLENIDFRITKKEIISIVGSNGGGKTTLLKLALGLLSPTRGSITISGMPPGKGGKFPGYVPQHINYDKKFPSSVMEVVLSGRLGNNFFGHYTQEDHAEAENVLGKANLLHLRKRSFSNLSGGERQRVLIARGLCGHAEIFFLDEPTASIDRNSEKDLFDLLKEVSKNAAVIIVSHDLGVVSSLSEKTLCVNRNVIIHPTSELKGENISALYGMDIALVNHKHSLEEGGRP